MIMETEDEMNKFNSWFFIFKKQRCGNFRLIYPKYDSIKFEKYFIEERLLNKILLNKLIFFYYFFVVF